MSEILETKLDSLDALAAQIDRAANALVRLKADNSRLTKRLADLESKIGGGDKKLEGKTLTQVVSEVETLRAAEKLWVTERKEIGHRVEELVKKLEKLDG